MNTQNHMTGAELATLREACGLSREDLATLASVQARTVKHWESGRAGVPADVAALVVRLDDALTQATSQARAAVADATARHGAPPADVVLLRYNTPQDLARYRRDMAGLPPTAHGALTGRVRAALQAQGVPVRVVWMLPELYEPWRQACQLPDDETTRSTWAAQQVQGQALPHQADQPPK